MSLGNISNPSKQDLEKFKTYQNQLQLLTGWLNISDDMIRHEIETCAVRQGIDLTNAFFILRADPVDDETLSKEVEWMVRDQKKDWLAFLRHTALEASYPSMSLSSLQQQGNVINDTNGGTNGGSKRVAHMQEGTVGGDRVFLVPVQTVCEGIFKMSTSHIPFSKISIFVTINTVANVCINLYANRHDLGNSAWTVLFYTCSTYMLLLWYFPLAYFIVTAVVDMYRQLHMCNLLEEMIRLCDVNTRDSLNGSCSLACISEKLDAVDRAQSYKEVDHEYDSKNSANPINTPSMITTTPVPAHQMSDKVPYAVPPMLGSLAYKKMASSGSGNDLFGYSNFLIPSLDLTYPQNVLSWCNCRTILNTVGTRFKLRISIYTGEFF